MDFFKALSISTSFPLCYNLLPHFTVGDSNYNTLVSCAQEAMKDGRIMAFYLSDSPRHQQKFSSLQLAADIVAAGGEPIVSLSASLHDRNTALDRLREYYEAGVRHFLFVTGDYPASPGSSKTEPVFDADSVQLLMLAAGFPEYQKIVKGCVVSPFKDFESEQVWQYEKLKRKLAVGADFVVSLPGFDIRKYDELVRFHRLQELTAPLVGNMLIADQQTARLVQARAIPGVKMAGGLLREFQEQEASDHRATVSRAAKNLAVLKGIGFDGALIGSVAQDFSLVKETLDEFERIGSEWQSAVAELDYSTGTAPRFYYFLKNPESGLNSQKPAPVALKHFPSPKYSFSYFIDWLVYVPEGPLFNLTGRFCRFSYGRRFWYSFLWLLEFISKRPLYGCTMCGDCTLYACGFLCYQSGCPKKTVNGPCGGSKEGYCELYPGKKRCFWVKVYHNMKGVTQQVSFVAPPIPARNNALAGTSSWINFFLGRDHRKMKFAEISKNQTE